MMNALMLSRRAISLYAISLMFIFLHVNCSEDFSPCFQQVGKKCLELCECLHIPPTDDVTGMGEDVVQHPFIRNYGLPDQDTDQGFGCGMCSSV